MSSSDISFTVSVEVEPEHSSSFSRPQSQPQIRKDRGSAQFHVGFIKKPRGNSVSSAQRCKRILFFPPRLENSQLFKKQIAEFEHFLA